MEFTEQKMDELYDMFQKEQSKLLADFKTGCESQKESDSFKQFNLMNTLMTTILKLRNLKKKIKSRMD